MIEYNNINYIIKDILNKDEFDNQDIAKALIIAYKDWKINKLRIEMNEIRTNVKKQLKDREVLCEKCGKGTQKIEMHHRIPVELGGDNSLDNIQFLCHKCHIKENKNTRVFDKAALTRDKSEPIKDEQMLNNILNELKEAGVKYYILMSISLLSGLNPNIIAAYSISDIINIINSKHIKAPISIEIPKKFIDILISYIRNKNANDIAFPSRKHGYNLSRQQLHRVIYNCCRNANYEGDISIEIMRKTFYYNYIKNNSNNVYEVMKVLNMNTKEEVYKYLNM